MVKTGSKRRYYFLLILVIPLLFLFSSRDLQDPFDLLPTEYAYSTEKLKECRSPILMTLERIDKWEKPLQAYFKIHNISYLTELRFYTYLYIAQKDAAFLSYNTHQCFIGSLDPLTQRVVSTFFPDFTDFPELITDLYSEELARQIWPPFLQRFEEENANPHAYGGCTRSIARWIPWISPLPKPPPPKGNLREQVEEMKYLRSHLTNYEKNLAIAWSDERQLRILANQFMEKERVPLGKTLYVRSKLMKGLYDASIAAFEAKYIYCTPRPYIIDPSIQLFIPEPDSPSYPSAHATQAGAAEVIMSYFFPEKTHTWKQIAEECAWSRIWSGVHTLQDTQEGMKLGQEVGKQTLNNSKRI